MCIRDSYEVLDGQLVISGIPLVVHQHVLGSLLISTAQFVEQHDIGEVILGPISVMLGTYDAVQPDIVFVSNERRGLFGPRGGRRAGPHH